MAGAAIGVGRFGPIGTDSGRLWCSRGSGARALGSDEHGAGRHPKFPNTTRAYKLILNYTFEDPNVTSVEQFLFGRRLEKFVVFFFPPCVYSKKGAPNLSPSGHPHLQPLQFRERRVV